MSKLNNFIAQNHLFKVDNAIMQGKKVFVINSGRKFWNNSFRVLGVIFFGQL